METLETVQVTTEAGLDGDFRDRSERRQVTVLAEEGWRAACAELGVELNWILRRTNLLVSGVALPQTPGACLNVGPLTLEVTGETDPCQRMDEQHQGLKDALSPDWRGGVTCRVVSAGEIRLGDKVDVQN